MSLGLVLAACTTDEGGGSGDGATADYPAEDISIMAPAAPGGGWDSTARAMQPVLEEVGEVSAEVYNVEGAGGTIGLAEFAEEATGDPHQLMAGPRGPSRRRSPAAGAPPR